MRRGIVLILACFFVIWAVEAFWLSPSPPGDLLWVMRQEGMLLTGILALGAMTAIMVLALRPRWLESPLGGMDKAYRLHKWLGIIAVALSFAHWLAKESKPLITTAIGNAGRLAKMPVPEWVSVLKPYAKTMGEWTFYALILMLIITLARRTVPYKRWYWLHRFMPLAYLLLVFHGIVLTPYGYWGGVGGWLLAATMTIGVIAAVMQLIRDLKPAYPHKGTVVSCTRLGDVLEVQCRLGDSWQGHKAGQFAFLRVAGEQEAHPFTLSDADQKNHVVRFHIKQLGDWTRGLSERLQPGLSIELDGPYGRFVPPDHDDGAVHVWVGAGVGATPFLSWLGQHHQDGHAPQAWLQYACQHANDPLAKALKEAAALHPDVHLDIFADGRRWTPEQVLQQYQAGKPLQVWFCGPAAMGKQLEHALKKSLPPGSWHLHNEHFEFR
ncbi:ferric reductase-like transmembrane domain-containing protein [Pusillimonas sp. NJUB218]|uniref:ferredoxin reductase family protein n=1 Tax=Pusillimonas sp. NJUB218 TaxID=2023230 RepID=UPI000F4B1F1E|nr:ferric reductase-like transmembrane domain-containing protein [Pusillimonas sp. NJUB218]ROT43984.1 cytochrome C [Pusillimonas sp. NJUB218]